MSNIAERRTPPPFRPLKLSPEMLRAYERAANAPTPKSIQTTVREATERRRLREADVFKR